MNRREFLAASSAALFTALVADTLAGQAAGEDLPLEWYSWLAGAPPSKGPAPRPEITAAVDVIVPPDPAIPGDFKGSDYGADRVVARELGDAGMMAAVLFLNKYSKSVSGGKFMDATPDERLEAIKAWIRDRDTIQPVFRELLTGLLTMSLIGTFEENSPEESRALFTSMGWFDPEDPSGTFRLPLEGYVDSFQFPQKLKKGLSK